MIELLNPEIQIAFGDALDYNPQFSPANALQGLGCVGDDGWISYGTLPDGLTADNGRITGTPTAFGHFQFTLEIIGTDDMCENQVPYFQATIHLYIREPNIFWSKNPIPIGFSDDGQLYTRAEYRLFVETHFFSNSYKEVFYGETALYDVATDTVYIQEELDALLEAEKLQQGLGPVGSFKQDTIIRFCYVAITQYTAAGASITFQTDKFITMLGGLRGLDYYRNRDSFWPEYLEKNIWLQFRGHAKTTSLQSPEYLFALCAGSSVVFTYYLGDGSTVSYSWICDPLRLHARSVMENAPANTVRIMAQMQRAASPYGEPLIWLIDQQPQQQERFVMFRNQYGIMETVRCTGELSEEEERAATVLATRYVKHNEHISISPQFVWKSSSEGTTKGNLSTGWISIAYRKYLAEQLTGCTEAYLYDAESGALIPINITSKKLESYQDNEFMAALSLEFNYLI